MSTLRSPEEFARELREAASPNLSYFIMTGLAAVLSGYGLLANSPAVIIGAMLVAMLLNPITGLSFALVVSDIDLIRRSASAEILGALMVFSVGLIIGKIHHNLPITEEMLIRTDPTLLDLVIAVAGGAAVSYAIGNSRLNAALAGVAIATSLVPPLANSGILVAMGQHEAARGAFLLYLGNYASVMMAAMIVFYAIGHRTAPGPAMRSIVAHPLRLFQFLLFALLVVSFGFRFTTRVEERTRMLVVEHALEESLTEHPGARLVELRIMPSVAPDAIIATVRAPTPISPTEVGRMQAAIPEDERGGLTLRVRTIPVIVAEPTGYLFTDPLP